eukprot:TRINITY_DN11958_c0_g1_i1.p1 TRINITY_DN11958_c0_g1~~TRINITY_DN11958_c0_g1_i1.p1  ORF type:complete len:233 (+),score=39.68 TRINITY_DN11958_c0_g1_i1:62-700(+)
MAKPQEDSGETSLVALLLNFLKEYHMYGQDGAVRAMLKDICEDGRTPEELGQFGAVTSRDVGEAFAAFETWKAQGRPGMPAWYHSSTYNSTLECFVVKQRGDGNLLLCRTPVEDPADQPVHASGDPVKTRPRPIRGWFVPPLPASVTVADFDGKQYGPEYLTLAIGDLVQTLEEDNSGWSYGKVLQRAAGNRCSDADLKTGWFPPDYVKPRE